MVCKELSPFDYLSHHGIKGQRWGVRRFQNGDGTLTLAGKDRYSGDDKTDKRKKVAMGMDDWYSIVETKEEAKTLLEKARSKFATLGYELNEKTEIYPLRHGIDFCGFRVYLTRTGKVIRKLRTSSKKRVKRRIKKWEKDYAEGLVTKEEIETSFQSSCAHIKHGDTKDLIADLRGRVDRIYEQPQKYNKEEDSYEQKTQHPGRRVSRKAQRKRCR